MSAPDTNIEKQKEKHATPLFGIGGVVAFAGVLLLGLLVWLSATGNEPGTDETAGGSAATTSSDG